VSAIARVSGGKKRPKPRGVSEGQGTLLEGEEPEAAQTEGCPAPMADDEREAEAEELAAEEFEEAEEGDLAEE
jgi:hypothetical protein